MSALIIIGLILILVFGFNFRAGGILLLVILVPLSLAFLIGMPFYVLHEHLMFNGYSYDIVEIIGMAAAVIFFPITIVGFIVYLVNNIPDHINYIGILYLVNAVGWGVGGFWYAIFAANR